MPELWARAPDATNRKLSKLYAQDGTEVNRKLKSLWAGDGTGVARKIFSGYDAQVHFTIFRDDPMFASATADSENGIYMRLGFDDSTPVGYECESRIYCVITLPEPITIGYNQSIVETDNGFLYANNGLKTATIEVLGSASGGWTALCSQSLMGLPTDNRKFNIYSSQAITFSTFEIILHVVGKSDGYWEELRFAATPPWQIGSRPINSVELI